MTPWHHDSLAWGEERYQDSWRSNWSWFPLEARQLQQVGFTKDKRNLPVGAENLPAKHILSGEWDVIDQSSQRSAKCKVLACTVTTDDYCVCNMCMIIHHINSYYIYIYIHYRTTIPSWDGLPGAADPPSLAGWGAIASIQKDSNAHLKRVAQQAPASKIVPRFTDLGPAKVPEVMLTVYIERSKSDLPGASPPMQRLSMGSADISISTTQYWGFLKSGVPQIIQVIRPFLVESWNPWFRGFPIFRTYRPIIYI